MFFQITLNLYLVLTFNSIYSTTVKMMPKLQEWNPSKWGGVVISLTASDLILIISQ